MDSYYVIAGLGNPGRQYDGSRHNAGFDVIDELADRLGIGRPVRFGKSLIGKGMIGGQKVILMKPLTYMNLSGESIGELARFFKINNDEILIVHDELELPIGTVSLKWSGGLGGHNGLRSAKAVLGTADFWRLRFGISKPANTNIADYVLSNFTADERIILAQEFAPTNEMFCKLLLSTDPNRILQGWSKKRIVEK